MRTPPWRFELCNGDIIVLRQGDRGYLREYDQILTLNGVRLDFATYLHAIHRGAWAARTEYAIRQHFYLNEDAIWPPTANFEGAEMLRRVEAHLPDIDAALAELAGTFATLDPRSSSSWS